MFDPQDPSVLADPYPHYARLRREAPVFWLRLHDTWIVSRYRDVQKILRDTETFSSQLGMAADFGSPDRNQTGVNFRIGAPGVRVLIALDPPGHSVFRRAVSAAFTPKGISRLTERINGLARERVQHLVECAAAGGADFCHEVAEPVPALVLAELFGMPAEMREDLHEWARVVTADLDGSASGAEGLGRGLTMLRYLRKEITRRRDVPDDSLLSTLADARSRGLSDYEILAFCTFLVVAGVETTTNQLTNLMDVLTSQPDVQARLRAEPHLIPFAVEEALRYDPPVQALWRSTTRETTLADTTLPAGARIFVLFASANRDETQFPDADRFVLDRQPNDHLAFGFGSHYCLGTRLARAEILAVLRELLSTTSLIESTGDSIRTQSVVLRGFRRQGIRVRL